jgi:hypothetical protein
MRAKGMTDVSEYGHELGIYRTVRLSPSVRIDLQDVPPSFQQGGENDFVRLMRILGDVRNALARSPSSAKSIPFVSALAVRSQDPEDVTVDYPLVARIGADGSIEILKPAELKEGVGTGGRARARKFSPIEPFWDADIN